MDGAGSPSIDALLAQARDAAQNDRVTRCCCGRPQCAFLEHNSTALAGLEKDLVSAAQIGQALLIRHQTHMVESEAERLRMNATIEQLEVEKHVLETDNARKIEENRELLDRLQELNHQVSDSDAQIQSLTASLQATQLELQRLTVLTQRTSSLEAQLFVLESEHAQLQAELTTTEEGQRSALQRWRRAEATIGELQEQIDRIEREAKEERERHMEVIGRMERTRAVEKELDSAAGRVNGASSKMLNRQQNSSQVVSRFVRDILQDNANLQSGVVELRELLMSSNAEVETLREQLRVHRPVEENEGALATLSYELKDSDGWNEQRSPHPDAGSLHVHHHYHAPNITVRKPKKKRPSISATQASGASTPRVSRIKDWRANTPSSFATILSQTSASIPSANHQHRWSTQSTNTMSSFASSGPSSPRQNGSIFDTIEGAAELSQPTTPASSIPGSPLLGPTDITPRKPVRSASGPLTVQLKSRPSLGELSSAKMGESSLEHGGDTSVSPLDPITPFGTETILEESEQIHSEAASYLDELSARPRLRRAASHESLLSISGMDIHTLRDRPSQLLLGGPFSPRGANANPFASPLSPQAATSHETARPAFNGRGLAGGDHARSLLHSVHTRPGIENRPSLTQKVGGWVWSRWGVAPTAEQRLPQPQRPPARPFGINQRGPIPGLAPPPKTPSQVETDRVDSALLRESLGDMLVREDLGI